MKMQFLAALGLVSVMPSAFAATTCFDTDVAAGEVVVAIQADASCNWVDGYRYTVLPVASVPVNGQGQRAVCAGWQTPTGYTVMQRVNGAGCAAGRDGGYSWLNTELLVWNRAPIGGGRTYSLQPNESVSGSAAMTDPDGDVLVYTFSGVIGGGNLQLHSQTGDFTYTPAPNFEGKADATIQASDGKGGSAYYLLTFNVGSVSSENRPPVIGEPSFMVSSGVRMPFRIFPTDPDGDTVTWHVDLTRPPLHGYLDTITAGDLYAYRSLDGYVGEDRIFVIATDSRGASSTGTVRFNVISADADGDGMPTAYENQWGLNPWDTSDASLDLDNDGLSNLGEYHAGTKPTIADTDGDGMPDGYERNRSPLNPLSAADAAADNDGDGYSNLSEYQAGTDPLNAQFYPGNNPAVWLVPIINLLLY